MNKSIRESIKHLEIAENILTKQAMNCLSVSTRNELLNNLIKIQEVIMVLNNSEKIDKLKEPDTFPEINEKYDIRSCHRCAFYGISQNEDCIGCDSTNNFKKFKSVEQNVKNMPKALV